MRSAPMKPAREPVQTALDTLPLAALSRHSLISSTADGPPVEDGGAAAAGAAEGSCVDCAIAGTANKRVAKSKIGSASCRERVCQYVSMSVVGVSIETQLKKNAPNNVKKYRES